MNKYTAIVTFEVTYTFPIESRENIDEVFDTLTEQSSEMLQYTAQSKGHIIATNLVKESHILRSATEGRCW